MKESTLDVFWDVRHPLRSRLMLQNKASWVEGMHTLSRIFVLLQFVHIQFKADQELRISSRIKAHIQDYEML
jgi:hypothetical protein